MIHWQYKFYTLRLILFFFVALGTVWSNAQTAHRHLRDADKAYDNKAFTDAEEKYRDAVTLKPSAQAKFNLGNALYEQERYEEATKEFQQAVNLSSDTFFRAKALYNKGNSLLKQGNTKESLEAYKRSLLLNPDDEDVKKNFMLALQQQQKQQQQQQQQNDKNEEENNEENQNDQQEQQQNQPPPENQDEGEEDQPQQEEQESRPEEQPAEPQDQEDMTRELAEQLLQIIENADAHVQKKIKKQNSGKKESEKNW